MGTLFRILVFLVVCALPSFARADMPPPSRPWPPQYPPPQPRPTPLFDPEPELAAWVLPAYAYGAVVLLTIAGAALTIAERRRASA